MKIHTIILSALLVTSCGDAVRFETPQPEGVSSEKRIPKKLVGQYASLDDSSKLTISNHLIIRSAIASLSARIDSVDMKGVTGDTSYTETEYKMHFEVKVKGDSTWQRWSYYDTLFDVSRGDVLKKYKGRYFLNEQVSTNSWRVTVLTRIDNGVTLGTVSTKDDIDNLRELTNTSSDSVFSFRPTKKELKKFLKENGFSEKDTYLKIR